MPKPLPENELKAIVELVRRHPEGITVRQIADALQGDQPLRTLQYRLQRLVDDNRLVKEGGGRWTKYCSPSAEGEDEHIPQKGKGGAKGKNIIPLSESSRAIRAYLQRPLKVRKPVGYNRDFFESYRPDTSAYLTRNERIHLAALGNPYTVTQPAGTYARTILNRLLIDLSWNSSRLEGNTYSLLDTTRLIEFGQEAEGRNRLEAQMILNHKDAIEFLVEQANEIGFNRYTILNLHAMLADNLLADETAAGRLRHIPVGIEQSTFYPLEIPQLIEEFFDQILAKTAAIDDPFEQALFFMVQLPYLQPFDDVNKRVSRIAANIPLIKSNLAPMSFIDVPRAIYTEAVLGVYEMNRIDLLKDVFIWAYERSAARYAAVRQSLGDPDPFRMQHSETIRTVVGDIVRRGLGRRDSANYIAAFANENLKPGDREQFREVAENALLALHEGNYARYKIRPVEFKSWRLIWHRATA